ncbi:putative ran guanine nucleotide release factor [Colletotrichum chlorophyti]|uniref:Putative ran guanine nucleotide release factor n=1 Tax=Colletotrichum chlorophyti TaxID=708187 RepID=A0A1Q8RTP3_9PEZI|nr:putative ran guanine nucleotide release factor [Colletotrichum chlorophyti]
MTRYKSTPLYGGAIVCDLPEKFADVSKLREVPDNQEVWIDSDGFTSIIVDITERVGPAGSSPEIDGRAMTTHLEELVGDEIDTVKVWNTTETSFSRLSTDVPAYTLIATQTPRSKSGSSSAAPDFTAIILTLLRLEKESTDILITINVPHIKGEYDEADVDLELGRQGKLIGDAVEYAARIWETFKVKDWGLFQEV